MYGSSETRRIPIWLIGLTAALGLFALLGSVAADVRRVELDRDAALAWRTHSYEVIIEANELLAAMQAAETGYRGYLLTGDTTFRAPYDRDRSRIAGQLEVLRRMLAADPAQAGRYGLIAESARRRLAKLDLGMLLLMRGKRSEAMQSVKTGEGQRAMETFRRSIVDLKSAEMRLLAARAAGADEATSDARVSLVAAALVGLMLLFVAGLLALSAWRAALNDIRREAAEAVPRREIDGGDRYAVAA